MTRTSHSASRQAAARTADDLLAERAARFHEREQELRRLVTDYHHAAARIRKIDEDTKARTAKIAADAETRIAAVHELAKKEASEFQDAANTAVRAILQFGEPTAAVANLTQLTVAQVRAIERAAPSATNRNSAAQPGNQHTPPTDTTP